MKLNSNTGQYDALLAKYQRHVVKGGGILFILVAAGLSACYYFMFSNPLDLMGFMFMLGPLLIVGLLAYSLFRVVTLHRLLSRDREERSYESFIDLVQFIQSTNGRAKFSNKLVLKNHKEALINLTNVEVVAGSTYEFTVSRRTQLIVDLRLMEKDVEQQQSEFHAGQGMEVPLTSKRILLEQEELKGYRQSHIVPTFIVAALLGGFLGMLAAVLMLLAVGRFIDDYRGQFIIGVMIAGAGGMFYFLLRFNQRHNAKVLANPYKRILASTIESVKEADRKRGTRYVVYFNVKDNSEPEKLKVELTYTQLELLKKQEGYFYLHVEENHNKVLKIVGEDKSEVLRFY